MFIFNYLMISITMQIDSNMPSALRDFFDQIGGWVGVSCYTLYKRYTALPDFSHKKVWYSTEKKTVF